MAEETQADTPVDTADTKSTDDSRSIAEVQTDQLTPESNKEDSSESSTDDTAKGLDLDTDDSDDTISDETDSDTNEDSDDDSDDTDDIPVTRNKDGFKRGIEKLKRQLQTANDKIANLETAKAETPKPKEKEYSEAQLKQAMQKAVEEGDSDLIYEIMDYKLKRQETKLKDEYQQSQKQATDSAREQRAEWTQILKDHSPLVKEYGGEFNLKDQNSDFYKSAWRLFNGYPVDSNDSGDWDENMYQKYHRLGVGKAVSDALVHMIKGSKRSKSSNKAERSLKNKLVKERRKRSLTSNSGKLKGDTPPKRRAGVMTDKERLDDVLSERNKFKESAMGIA